MRASNEDKILTAMTMATKDLDGTALLKAGVRIGRVAEAFNARAHMVTERMQLRALQRGAKSEFIHSWYWERRSQMRSTFYALLWAARRKIHEARRSVGDMP